MRKCKNFLVLIHKLTRKAAKGRTFPIKLNMKFPMAIKESAALTEEKKISKSWELSSPNSQISSKNSSCHNFFLCYPQSPHNFSIRWSKCTTTNTNNQRKYSQIYLKKPLKSNNFTTITHHIFQYWSIKDHVIAVIKWWKEKRKKNQKIPINKLPQ